MSMSVTNGVIANQSFQENKRLENEVQAMNRKYGELHRAYMDSHKRIDESERLNKKVNIISLLNYWPLIRR